MPAHSFEDADRAKGRGSKDKSSLYQACKFQLEIWAMRPLTLSVKRRRSWDGAHDGKVNRYGFGDTGMKQGTAE
jgi:hypothetical protein